MSQSSRLARAIRLGVVAILMSAPLASALPAEAATDVAWNVSCPISHFGPDDPIVKPNMPGASHMHSFYGNNSTNAASTTASLLASTSSCQRGFGDTDHSGYWIPSLYRKLPSGGLQQITGTAKDLTMTIYYRGDGSTGQKVTPFPQGLRMVAGDGEATAPQSTNIVYWSCRTPGSNGSGQARTATIPTCPASQFLHATIKFPNCWDGKNLDSADHKSHMAYMTGKACPASHPVRTPAVVLEAGFKTVSGDSSQYMLSSGGQLTMHGDFFAAWDNQVQSALVNSCLNVGKKCTGIQRSQVNLSAATPGSGKVLAASTTKTLPATGPLATLGGVVGISAIAYTFYSYRTRRRSLRRALSRRG